MYDLFQLHQEVLRFYIFQELGLEYSKDKVNGNMARVKSYSEA